MGDGVSYSKFSSTGMSRRGRRVQRVTKMGLGCFLPPFAWTSQLIRDRSFVIVVSLG